MQPQVGRPRTKVLVVRLRAKHALLALASPMSQTVAEQTTTPSLHIKHFRLEATSESSARSFLVAR